MRLDAATLAAILAMAAVTYATRLAGFALVRRLDLRGRARLALEAVPGAVLMAPGAQRPPGGRARGRRDRAGRPAPTGARRRRGRRPQRRPLPRPPRVRCSQAWSARRPRRG